MPNPSTLRTKCTNAQLAIAKSLEWYLPPPTGSNNWEEQMPSFGSNTPQSSGHLSQPCTGWPSGWAAYPLCQNRYKTPSRLLIEEVVAIKIFLYVCICVCECGYIYIERERDSEREREREREGICNKDI